MDAWDVRDWRRRTFALYESVRATEDPRDAHRLWANGRDAMLSDHAASPVPVESREGFRARVARYDPELRFTVPVEPVDPERWNVQTASDGVVPFERVGQVVLPSLGSLDVWWLDSYGGGIFLPLRDGSPETYGGGRYVLDTVKGADLGGTRDSLVVDLNFAYQPSCAYSSDWVCPLPGSGNRIAPAVDAGELIRS